MGNSEHKACLTTAGKSKSKASLKLSASAVTWLGICSQEESYHRCHATFSLPGGLFRAVVGPFPGMLSLALTPLFLRDSRAVTIYPALLGFSSDSSN